MLRYAEPLNDARTMLAGFFSILLGNPVGEKHIELSRRLGLPIRYPDQAGTIRREHGETIELPVEREPLKTLPVLTDRIEVKAWPASFAFRFNIR
jgi:hypothetical protein